MDGSEVTTVVSLAMVQDHGHCPVSCFGDRDPVIGEGDVDDRRDLHRSVMFGSDVLLTLKPLNVEDQAVWGSIQILPFFFIGPLIDHLIQNDSGFSWWANEVDRHLFTFFQDTIGLEVEEFPSNVLGSGCGVEVSNKVTNISLLLIIKVGPNVQKFMNLSQEARPRRRKEGSEGPMKPAPRLSVFHGEATQPAPASEDGVAKAQVAVIGSYASEVLSPE